MLCKREGVDPDYISTRHVGEPYGFSIIIQFEVQVKRPKHGGLIGIEHQVSIGIDGGLAGCPGGNSPLGGIVQVVGQVESGHINGCLTHVINLNPVTIVSVFVQHSPYVGSHYLVDTQIQFKLFNLGHCPDTDVGSGT